METKNIMIVGVGGQGTLLTSRILGGIITKAGYDVKLSEVHGMAQRGGSVFSHVRIGEGLYSPMIAAGTADQIIGFEPGETVRMLPYLKEDGHVVVSTRAIKPVTAPLSESNYDSEPMLEYLKQNVPNLTLIDADKACAEIGSSKVLNMILLGTALRTGVLDFNLEDIEHVMLRTLPEKFHAMNLQALNYTK